MTKLLENPNPISEMSFIEHLKDLRKTVTRSCIGILLGTIFSLYWSSEIFAFITLPLKVAFEKFELIGTGPAEAFITKLEVSFISGLLLSSPFSFLQLWLFISPALYAKEKKIAIPFVFISSILFLSGIYFCYIMMFPYAFKYFYEEYQSIGITPNIKIDEYLGFVTRMVLVFGLVFELPVVCFFLSRLGIVSHTWLLKNFKYLIVGIFLIAGILTPPDIISQMLLAAPLTIIYLMCLIIAYVSYPKKQ